MRDSTLQGALPCVAVLIHWYLASRRIEPPKFRLYAYVHPIERLIPSPVYSTRRHELLMSVRLFSARAPKPKKSRMMLDNISSGRSQIDGHPNALRTFPTSTNRSCSRVSTRRTGRTPKRARMTSWLHRYPKKRARRMLLGRLALALYRCFLFRRVLPSSMAVVAHGSSRCCCLGLCCLLQGPTTGDGMP